MSCHSPIYVKTNQFRQDVPVPCGKCPPCLKRRVDSWVFRLLQEDKVSTSSHFVTLTYDTRSVPISKNGFMTLDKKAFPAFMKRLRKNTGIKGIRYYACGEYGTKNDRPHYHAIIFNVPTVSAFADAWSYLDCGERVAFGQLDVGQVSGDSIGYVCKYMDKRKQIPKHARDDRQPEFSLMSKGLGANYLTDQARRYHKSHLDQLYLTKPGGFRIAMPKYYRDKIFSDDEKKKQLHLVKHACDLKIDEVDQVLIAQGVDPDLWRYERKLNTYFKFHRTNNRLL